MWIRSAIAVVLLASSMFQLAAEAQDIAWVPAHDWAPQGMSSNLAAGDLDCDGDIDITMLGVNPARHYWNVGSAEEPIWSEDTSQFSEVDYCHYRCGGFGDLDADGDLDLAVICYDDDFVRFYWNTGSCAAAYWEEDLTVFAGLYMPMGGGQPRLADMDADGDLDLLYAGPTGRTLYARNAGTSTAPSFEYVGQIMEIPLMGSNARHALGDLDGDGDLDIVRITLHTQPECFENIGTPQSFEFVENPQMIVGAGFPPDGFALGIELADMDGDGDPDLFLSDGFGQNLFYLNDGVVPVEPTSWGVIKATYR